MSISNKIIGSEIIKAVKVLSKSDQKKVVLVLLIQIFLGLFDLLGVILFGILASLTFSGLSNKIIGDRTKQMLDLLNISNSTFKEKIIYVGVIAAVILVLKTITSLYLTKRTLYFLSRRSAELSSILSTKFLSQRLPDVQLKSIQEVNYSLINGPSIITVGIIGGVVSLISDISLLIILLSGLFYVDVLIAFLTLVVFGLIGTILYFMLRVKVRRFGILESQNSIETSEKIYEAIASYREIFVKNRRNFYSQEIRNLRFRGAKLVADNSFYQGLSKYVIEVTVVLGALAISAIQLSIHTPEHAVAVLGIFLAASTRIAPAVLRAQQGFLGLTQNIGAASPTLQLIDRLSKVVINKIESAPLNFMHEGFSAEIQAYDLMFTFSSRNIPTIDKVNLKIKKGEIVSIVGPSGAGKTTLVDLMLGLIMPDSGDINISGVQPIEAINKWSGAITYVPQDINIINGTIRDNIIMGYSNNEVIEGYIQNAINIAKLNDFISSLPEGIDTEVGARGTKISGGQRQRLGIARAMFTNPSMVVFDEATSALDANTEEDINKSIQDIKGKVTVIIIAHRLSTVRNSDTVIYLDKGKILASGKFEDVRNQIPDFDKQAKLMGL